MLFLLMTARPSRNRTVIDQMTSNNVSPVGLYASSFIEDDELAQLAQELACPNCGDLPVEIVRVLSPEEATSESVAAFKGGLVGALAGGIAGAPFGPGGIGAGMGGGALVGSEQARKEAKKERLVASCRSCGYHGRAA